MWDDIREIERMIDTIDRRCVIYYSYQMVFCFHTVDSLKTVIVIWIDKVLVELLYKSIIIDICILLVKAMADYYLWFDRTMVFYSKVLHKQ